jgi:hypothetical protein
MRSALTWLIGRAGRLTVAYAGARSGGTWGLARILIRLPGILGRTLVRILVLILRRAIGRGNLSILHIGRRSCLAPVTRLAWRRCLLRGLLCRRNQGRSQCKTGAQHSGNYPSRRIHC